MRLTQLANTLTAHRWQIEAQNADEVRARPSRGVERSLLGAYVILFTGLVLLGLHLAVQANAATIRADELIALFNDGEIETIIREDGVYIVTLEDGSRERLLDPNGTLFTRFERAGVPAEAVESILEVRSDGNDTLLFSRLLIGVLPLVIVLSALFIGGMWLLSRIRLRREHVFTVVAGDHGPRIHMQDHRGTWELDSEREFERVVQRRGGVGPRIVILIWIILSLAWLAGSLITIVIITGNTTA